MYLVRRGGCGAEQKRENDALIPLQIEQQKIRAKQRAERGKFRKVRGFPHEMIYFRGAPQLFFFRQFVKSGAQKSAQSVIYGKAYLCGFFRRLCRHYEDEDKQ
jgi:hypothetical protein